MASAWRLWMRDFYAQRILRAWCACFGKRTLPQCMCSSEHRYCAAPALTAQRGSCMSIRLSYANRTIFPIEIRLARTVSHFFRLKDCARYLQIWLPTLRLACAALSAHKTTLVFHAPRQTPWRFFLQFLFLPPHHKQSTPRSQSFHL